METILIEDSTRRTGARNLLPRLSLLAAVALLVGAAVAGPKQASAAALVEYYVGRDGLATIATGTYAGLANPNFGRLTLLYQHFDHFHGIGSRSYIGTPPSQTTRDTNANNRIPEIGTQPPLPLRGGSGIYSGLLASGAFPGEEYSDLGMRAMNSLAGFPAGSQEQVLFNSSGGRWNGSIGGTLVGLEVISRTPGLGIGDASTLDLFGTGNRISIGNGGSLSFLPVFWVAAGAAPMTYTAEMRLVSLDPNLNPIDSQSGGRFFFDFQPTTQIPLPAGFWLMGSALLLIGGKAFRRTRATI